MKIFKKLVLILVCVNFLNASEFTFKDVSLEEFRLSGVNKKIEFKTKEQRDFLVQSLWEDFFNSNAFANAKNDDKLMVVYSNYKKNSFYCFIGIKTDKTIKNTQSKIITKRNFNRAKIKYSSSFDMKKLWDKINKLKIKRDFQVDMEEYNMSDIVKNTYDFNIYLSKK